MPKHNDAAEKIITNIKGLNDHLQEDEQPIMTIPAIWDGGQSRRSTPCDIILTNQRLFGYYFSSFPRERLFLDALSLSAITGVSLRQKTFEPIFRELLVSEGQRKVYIRAPRQKIETLYSALRMAIESYAPEAELAIQAESAPKTPIPIFGRQDIHKPLERSSLAITALFIGGLLMEIGGGIVWASTHSGQIGLPLCIAGFVAVFAAFLTLKQQTR